MKLDDIKAYRLINQHLIKKSDPLDTTRDLCGLQAQFFSNAEQALKIRSEKLEEGWIARHLIKNWTLRGTMHVFALEDLPLFLHCNDGRDYLSNDWSKPSFWNRRSDWALTPERQAYCTQMILDLLSEGPMGRDVLKDSCLQNGMSPEETASMFHPWGGGVRQMCERGMMHYIADEKKIFALTPEYSPMREETAELVQAERYFRHYGPATLHDLMYFFHVNAKKGKEWLAKLPLHSAVCAGKEYFYIDLPDDSAVVPECIFLAGFDPLMMGYEKKESMFLNQAHLRKIFNLAGIVMPALLINGNVVGIWKRKDQKVTVTAFSSFTAEEKSIIEKTANETWQDIQTIQFE